MRGRPVKFVRNTGRIAIINPLGDYGINQYVYELCEGLAEHGVIADVYTSSAPELPAPQRHHRFHVMGSVLLKQRSEFKNPKISPPYPAANDWLPQAIDSPIPRTDNSVHHPQEKLSFGRAFLLSAEFVVHLHRQNYDWIWTQWPDMEPYHKLPQGLRLLGVPLVHTVHNVLPHEESAANQKSSGEFYRAADALIVHSEYALSELRSCFPDVCPKANIVPHMTYTLFPRLPDARARLRAQMGLTMDSPVAIVSGGIRPYKNIEAVIEAFSDPRLSAVSLIIAGRESGYPDPNFGDALFRTRRLVSRYGLEHRIRLIPRFLSTYELSELLEATDFVLLPYRQGYGSGQLMLAMTFGKAIIATGVGGAEEYLSDYDAGYLLPDPSASAIADTLSRALKIPAVTATPSPRYRPAEVARSALATLGVE